MKKIRLILLAAIVSVSFAACGDKKAATDDTSNAPATEAPAQAPAATLSETDQFVADYEKLTNDLIAITEKLNAGDLSVVEEAQKLSQSYADFGVKAQEMMSKLSEEQQKKIQEILAKYAAVAQKAVGQ